MTPSPLILDVHGLTFAYPGQPPLATDWSTAVHAGVTLAHGDTGSGKSTLLRWLAGTERVAGRLTLAGVRLDQDAAAYQRRVFFIDPADPAHDALLARDVIGTAGARHAEGFALWPHLHKPLFMLSTGSRRKVWLAAALASTCPLTLLDEPMGALDAASREHLAHALGELAHQRERAIVVASSQARVAMPLAGTITLPLQGV